ncbi:MAG: hypothetical protein H8K07_13875 [Nitrospira sp.]|nr:hypothetical protein [Nitrospira sp.]MDI3467048.1 hypothetical protein [Nitrospira sp.]
MKANLPSFSGSEAVRPFWSPLYHVEEVQRWLTGQEYGIVCHHVLNLSRRTKTPR